MDITNQNSLTADPTAARYGANRIDKAPKFVRSKDRCHIITRTPIYDINCNLLAYNFRFTAGEESFRPDQLLKKHVKHVLIGFFIRRPIDDFIQREYFEKAVTILKKYTPKILINTYKLYYDNDNVIDTFIKDKNIKLSKNEFLKGIFEGKKYNWSPFCKFFHSSITHLLKFNKEYCFGEDLLFIYDLINKLSSSDVIVYSPLSCYMYVQRNTSACYSYPVEKRYDCIKIYEYIINTSDKDVSEYVYLNLYLTYLIKLKFHMLQCNYDVRSNYYIKCCSEPKKNFFKNICNPRMKFKSRILILLNCLPNFIFKRIMLVALTKKYKCF